MQTQRAVSEKPSFEKAGTDSVQVEVKSETVENQASLPVASDNKGQMELKLEEKKLAIAKPPNSAARRRSIRSPADKTHVRRPSVKPVSVAPPKQPISS